MKIRRAIVTGGLGFIGSHLVEALLQRGSQVTVIDNLATGRRSNLSGVTPNAPLQILEQDVAAGTSWASSLDHADTLFHLAALADIVPSIQRPLDYFRANVIGTAQVMEACRNYGIKKVIYAASSSCYGIAQTLPTPETAPIQPQYPYALTKNLGEQLALHWGNVYDLPVLSMRFFNVYGPRSRTTGAYGAVFGVFLAQRLAGKPLTIVGDGTQTRDFTFVTDVVEAMIAAAEGSVRGEIFNVGSGRTVSVNLLADLIGGPRTYIPKRPGEPDGTFADISKIKKMLDWKPKVSFEKGVEQMLASLDQWKDAPVWTEESIHEATKDWFRYLSAEQTGKSR